MNRRVKPARISELVLSSLKEEQGAWHFPQLRMQGKIQAGRGEIQP
jgi:hypothetical protein